MFAGSLMRKYSTVLLGLPSAAVASGGDVLVSFWSQLALLAVVVLSLFIARLTVKAKALVFVLYFVAAVAVNWATWNMPYSRNQSFIVSISLVVPGACWLAALVLMHFRRGTNKTNRSRHDAARAARP
jgi:hypothetical protein